jgi:hypothetical protein
MHTVAHDLKTPILYHQNPEQVPAKADRKATGSTRSSEKPPVHRYDQ